MLVCVHLFCVDVGMFFVDICICRLLAVDVGFCVLTWTLLC